MKREVKARIQDVVETAIELVTGREAALLIYAEVEEGVVSATILSVVGTVIAYNAGHSKLSSAVYELWEAWRKTLPAWRSASIVVNGNKFTLEVIYPDKFDEKDTRKVRREREARRVFGELQIDYQRKP